jgi:methylthioribose-1-phosphate isomerase
MANPVNAIEWLGGRIRLIDQTLLPLTVSTIETDDPRVVAEAIRTLKVRGAPAIGIAAAYALAVDAAAHPEDDLPALRRRLSATSAMLAGTRPTAVNLFWALERMRRVLDAATDRAEAGEALVREAVAIHAEDVRMCDRIGSNGAELVPQGAGILTHCNTGALATGGAGTAQSVITTAHRQGKRPRVFADETRPLFQGARLTAWELHQAGVDVTVITDSMAASTMQAGLVDLVVVGADRIAANGDAANKIGTYGLAVLARHHGIPFYVAAPSTTLDARTATGADIPIEDRDPAEVTTPFGTRIVPPGVPVRSPSFDVTPAALITAIITETGVHRPPYRFTAGPR